MSFDEIFELTAGVYFIFFYNMICTLTVCSLPSYDAKNDPPLTPRYVFVPKNVGCEGLFLWYLTIPVDIRRIQYHGWIYCVYSGLIY